MRTFSDAVGKPSRQTVPSHIGVIRKQFLRQNERLKPNNCAVRYNL